MVSLMTSGPIPPHPYYDKSDNKAHLNLPVPRVRPEGQQFYEHGTKGTVAMVLQIEGQRVPSGYYRKSSQNKNHVSENVKRLRQIQREAKKRDESKQEPVKAIWKSSKYDEVESRVTRDLVKEPPAPRPASANFLRAHSRTGFIPQSARPASTEPPVEKLTIPKAQTAREVKLIRRDLDWIKMNGKAVKRAPMRRSPSASSLDQLKAKQAESERNYKRGEVPNYLNKRRDEWERMEKERIANMPDPELPAGHRKLPDDERKATLAKLKTTEMELHKQLATMPIRTDTLRVRTRKEELERKIGEVEEAIRIFSRPKVFVKLDS